MPPVRKAGGLRRHGGAPQSVDAIIDCVSAGRFPQAFDALVPGGKLVSICTMTDDGDIAGDTAEAERRGLKKPFCILESDDITEPLAAISGMVDDRRVRPPAIHLFPLEHAAEALQALKRGNVRGKVVVKVGG